jgi:hypothetical protein
MTPTKGAIFMADADGAGVHQQWLPHPLDGPVRRLDRFGAAPHNVDQEPTVDS